MLGEFIHRSPHYAWMVPIVYVVFFGLAALVIAVIAKYRPRWTRTDATVFVLAIPAVLVVLFPYLFQRLHWIAFLLLVIGIAAAAARRAAAAPPDFGQLLRRTTPWLAAAVVLFGFGLSATHAIGKAGGGRAASTLQRGPNVLLIILDTVRAANLSLYGYARSTTPWLDRLAARSVVFDQALSPAPWTLPSHASIFTGLLPHQLSADWLVPLDEAEPTLAEFFSERGYRTGGFVANLIYATYETGLDRGFHTYVDHPISVAELIRSSTLGRMIAPRRALRALIGTDELLGRRSAATINEEFLRWIDSPSDRRFFAFLNYFDAHDPYLPPDSFYHVIAGADRPGRLSPLRRTTPGQRRDGMDPDDLRLEINSYDASILYIDAQIAALFEALEDRRLLDNTLVIVTSDHGEEFGEHGAYLHGHTLYMPALHVPLLIFYPPGVPQGVRVEHSVGLTDLASTIAELTFDTAASFPGNSMARYWESSTYGSRGPVRSEVTQGVRLPQWYPAANGDMVSLVENGIHYIWTSGGGEELYDLEMDPGERANLADSPDAMHLLQPFRRARAHDR
ncbi:MAG: sulfatase [Longimicrobiales bacterium]